MTLDIRSLPLSVEFTPSSHRVMAYSAETAWAVALRNCERPGHSAIVDSKRRVENHCQDGIVSSPRHTCIPWSLRAQNPVHLTARGSPGGGRWLTCLWMTWMVWSPWRPRTACSALHVALPLSPKFNRPCHFPTIFHIESRLSKSHSVLFSLPSGCTFMKKTWSHSKVCHGCGSQTLGAFINFFPLQMSLKIVWLDPKN